MTAIGPLLLALHLAAAPGAPPAAAPQPPDGDGPPPEAVGAAEAGVLAAAPFVLSLGGGHHPAYGLGGWVGAARGGVRQRSNAPLALGGLAPELSLQVTYGPTEEGLRLGRLHAGVTWWREGGRLHLGAGGAVGFLWVDGPGGLDPGLVALLEVAARVEVARVAGARLSLDLRGGFDPWRPGDLQALAFATVRY